jgi:glutaminyl-peptide cyclotransferase
LFGEGIAIYGDRIIQLTWQSHIGLVYDKTSFELLRTFSYPTEGWGLTHDGARLIMSDGTATLHFLDPETFVEVGQVEVYDVDGPVVRLNELEYIGGEIYANIWQTDRIVRIDPQTGQVLGWVDLSGLLSPEDRQQPVDVLNGIAYDPASDRLFVTGKLWPKLFEIELVAAGS